MELKECDKCGKKDRQKNLKRIKGKWFCKHCASEKKKDFREHIKRDILGIRKRTDLLKEWKKQRKLRELEVPKIKGSKSRQVSSNLHFYITKDERQFLWRKYMSMGLDSISADKKVKEDIKFLSMLVEELREKKISDLEINSTFKEEFAKLIMKDEN